MNYVIFVFALWRIRRKETKMGWVLPKILGWESALEWNENREKCWKILKSIDSIISLVLLNIHMPPVVNGFFLVFFFILFKTQKIGWIAAFQKVHWFHKTNQRIIKCAMIIELHTKIPIIRTQISHQFINDDRCYEINVS